MEVEQAIYGEVRGGHALRLASAPSRIPAELASRLDLPDTAPSGVDWSPYISGFPQGDLYVLARTFADPAATRGGMVLSHAVIAPLVGATTAADLRPLLALLIAAPEPPASLATADVAISTEMPLGPSDLTPAAEALTTRGTGPVVRVGTQGFEDLVVALWFHLWPDLRARFAFRLSFGPPDIVETPKPSLVCTPMALVARWAGHRMIGTASRVPISRAAAILSGGESSVPVVHFAREIGAHLDQLADLPILQRAYELCSTPSPTFDECVSVLRLLDRLSPDPAVGRPAKVKLVERLEFRLRAATVSDVLLLRNLSTSGLPVVNTLWASLESWMATNRFEQLDDPAMLSAIDDALSTSTAVESWRRAILSGLVTASTSTSSAFSAAFWRWAQARPATLTALVH